MKSSDKPLAEQFGRNVRDARRRGAFSQEELGNLCSLHRTAIGMIEKGERLPRLDTVMKIATILNVQVADLLRDLPRWTPAYKQTGGWIET